MDRSAALRGIAWIAPEANEEVSMYARILTYQIRPGLIQQRLRHAREVSGPARNSVLGQKGRLILIAPSAL
jgi:hypothetical protein